MGRDGGFMGYYFRGQGSGQKPTIGAIVDILNRYPRNWPVDLDGSSDFGISVYVLDESVSIFGL